jgi:hypothetical protein
VREIRPGSVLMEQDGAARALPIDAVIIRIGGEPPYQFLERVGVRIVRKEIALAGATAAAG